MTEAAQVEVKEVPRIEVVTPENFDQYVNDKLGTVEAEPAEAELQEVESHEEHEEEPKETKGKKNGSLNQRFSELTEARKKAEARAENLAAQAKQEREAREVAERAAAELKAKYEPPKTDEIGPEPQPEQFENVKEYAKAVKDWTAEKTRSDLAKEAKETAEKQARQAVVDSFRKNQEAFKAKTEDYEQVVGESSVVLSDALTEAVVESDVGPQLLYHFAKNPDEANRLNQMPEKKALKSLGRLEGKFGGEPAETSKPAEKQEKQEKQQTVAEVSRAPAPISPLKGANAPVATLSGTDEVPPQMNYEQWKALRKSGKIR